MTQQKNYQGRMHGLQRKLMEDWYRELHSLYEQDRGGIYLMISGNPVIICAILQNKFIIINNIIYRISFLI